MRVRWQGIGFLAVLLLVWPSSAGAASQTVVATPFSQFTPPNVTVDIGDTVTWNNTGGFHDVVFDDGTFRAPDQPSFENWTVSHAFATAGTFRYYCSIHGAPNGVGMSGSVTVSGGESAVKPLHTPLAIAYKPCPEAAANRTHAQPLDHPACSPPVPVSDWLTVGTADSNQRRTNSVASIIVGAEPGNPGTAGDEANVRLVASATDVRRKAGLADYSGQLQAVLPLRITDSNNGPASDERATGDTTFTFAIPCTATADPNSGGACQVTTTVDALSPGAVAEGKKSVWEIGAVQVFDGGSDDVAATPGNTLFMSQALFVP
jgi:plastocyanin